MTIDIRATVNCSLGELIEGSISDSFIQGGLVFISGNCTIKGLLTPALGTVVTFSYTRDGVTTQIPRELRVLGSFADPFRNTTQVELGCTLTFLREARPLPQEAETEDPEERRTTITPTELVCRFPDPEFPQFPGDPSIPGQPEIPGYITADSVFLDCCARLGISGTAGLTARYYVDEFNYSSGYVNVIGQLLETESRVGFMTSATQLRSVSLTTGGGVGPVVDGDSIIDIAPLGIGELIPGRVVVRFNSIRLLPIEEGTVDPEDPSAPPEEGEEATPVYDNWEKSTTVGNPTEVEIFYKDPFFGTQKSEKARYTPYSETITTYGSGGNSTRIFNSETCQFESQQTGPDLSNSVIKRETRTRRILAEANGNYCSELLSTLQVYFFPGAIFPPGQTPAGYGGNRNPPLTLEGYDRVVETFEYDNQGNVIKTIVETYEPQFAFIGRLDIKYVYYELVDGQTEISEFPVSDDEVLVQRVITTVSNLYSTDLLNVESAAVPGRYDGSRNRLDPPIGQKVKVETWVVNALTQSGQQAIAAFKKNGAFSTLPKTQGALLSLINTLKLENVQVEVTRDRQLLSPPSRPTSQQLSSATETNPDAPGDTVTATTNADQQGRRESVEQFEVITSGASFRTVLDTSLPLSPDDVYGVNGNVIDGQSSAFAREYGRNQLRLIYGRRYGLNIQLAPDKMPGDPYSPLYLSANGFTIQYRTNGTNWAFSSDGVACSTDALYQGVIGGTGTPFVPVAPGVTTFPPAPTPTNSGEIDPSAPIPPFSEVVLVATGLRLGLTAQALGYSLAPVITTAAPGLALGVFISPDNHVFARPGVQLGLSVIHSLVWMASAESGLKLGVEALAQRGAISIATAGVRLGLRGGVDPEYEYVLALLRMNGNNFASVFIDESKYKRNISVLGSIYTDTSNKKYGSASGAFRELSPNGGLILPTDNAFAMGADDFTIESWVNNSSLSGAAFQNIATYGSAFEGAWQLYFVEGNFAGDGPYLVFAYGYIDANNAFQLDAIISEYSSFGVGTWRHIAFTREGNVGRLFVNGIAQVDILTNTTSHDFASRTITQIESTPKLEIGLGKLNPTDTAYTDFFYGRLDDLRITRGVARYTADFTPPTAELPAS